MKSYRFGLWRAATKGLFQLQLPQILPALCSVMLLFLFAPALAKAGFVTTTADSGPGSLRDVLRNEPNNGTVTFAANLSGQTILLTSGQIFLNRKVTIDASA